MLHGTPRSGVAIGYTAPWDKKYFCATVSKIAETEMKIDANVEYLLYVCSFPVVKRV